MNAIVRNSVLILLMWLMLAGVCLGKQVYLKDGGIINGQSAWQHGDKVFVKVNRDIIADFNLNEIDLRRTFPKSATHSSHPKRKIGAVEGKTITKPALSTAATTTSAPTQKTTIPPAPAAATAANNTPQPAATQTVPADSAPPADKGELLNKTLDTQNIAIPQQTNETGRKGSFPIVLVFIVIAITILIVAGQWIVFQKAGRAGWTCLIPFYNMYALMEISGKPGWWMLLLFVPLVGVVIYLFSMLSLAKKFGRSELFGVGLFFIPMIFFPLLAFGSSEYER